MEIPMTQTVNYFLDNGQNSAQNELMRIPQIKQTNKQATYKKNYHFIKIPMTQTVTYSKDRGTELCAKGTEMHIYKVMKIIVTIPEVCP